MKILRANSISFGWENCLNQHFEIPNSLEYGWEICHGKLEPNWSDGPALPSFEINQGQNNLESLSDLNQDRDTTTLDSDEETDGLYISDENNDYKYC